MEKHKLNKIELQKAFQEQLSMLNKSCQNFDKGEILEANHIAIHLRILWHNSKTSKGLVSQLNLIDKVVDTSFIVPPTFTVDEQQLPISDERRLFAIGGNRNYSPLFDYGPSGLSKCTLLEWWEGSVLSDSEGHKFTRKDLVLAIANTDGGAHVDSHLDLNYYKLTREGNYGVIRLVPTDDPKVFKKVETPSPVAVTLRQIGHESLKTLIPEYSYDGRQYYPGVSICFMTAHISTEY